MSDQSVQNSLYFRNNSNYQIEQSLTMDTENSINIRDNILIITLFFEHVLSSDVRSLEEIVEIINIVFDIPLVKQHTQFMKSLKARIQWESQKQQELLLKLKHEHETHLRSIKFYDEKKFWTNNDMILRMKNVQRRGIIQQKQRITKKIFKLNEDLLDQYKSLQQKINQINDNKFNPYGELMNQSNQMQSSRNNTNEYNMIATQKNNNGSHKDSPQDRMKFQRDPVSLKSVRSNTYQLEIKEVKQKNKIKNYKSTSKERIKFKKNPKKKRDSKVKSPRLNVNRSSSSQKMSNRSQSRILRGLFTKGK